MNKKNTAFLWIMMTTMSSTVSGVNPMSEPVQINTKSNVPPIFKLEKDHPGASPEQMIGIAKNNLIETITYIRNYDGKTTPISYYEKMLNKALAPIYIIDKNIPIVLKNVESAIAAAGKEPLSEESVLMIRKNYLIDLKNMIEEKVLGSLLSAMENIEKDAMKKVTDSGFSEKEQKGIKDVFDKAINGIKKRVPEAFLPENSLLEMFVLHTELWLDEAKKLEEIQKQMSNNKFLLTTQQTIFEPLATLIQKYNKIPEYIEKSIKNSLGNVMKEISRKQNVVGEKTFSAVLEITDRFLGDDFKELEQ